MMTKIAMYAILLMLPFTADATLLRYDLTFNASSPLHNIYGSGYLAASITKRNTL